MNRKMVRGATEALNNRIIRLIGRHDKGVVAALDQVDSPTTHAAYASLVRWCGDGKALEEGRRVHAHLLTRRFHRNTFLANLLVEMYGKCGSMADAWTVFCSIRNPNTFSWNFILAASVQNGFHSHALHLYTRMKTEHLQPNKFTFLPLLSASANLRSLEHSRQIHQHVVDCHLHSDINIATTLVHTYGKCGRPEDARSVFDQTEERDLVLWNAMIAAYAHNEHGKDALELFTEMDSQGIKPDKVTFLGILDACTDVTFLDYGRRIHEQIAACGFESDLSLLNALVNMYGKCGSLLDALKVFSQIDEGDVVSWTAMIAAYTHNNHAKEALELFRNMDLQGIKPDKVTFLTALEACSSLTSLENGKIIHKHIVASGFHSDVTVSNALVNMYGKCGSLKDACAVFQQMHQRNAISWNAMIAAYIQNGHSKEALKLFKQMRLEGSKINKVTLLTLLNAHACLASLKHCKEFHELIVASGFGSDVIIMNALVNVYGKCGSVDEAREVFDKIHGRDIISWNAMIATYAQNGDGEGALHLFTEMELEGMKPTAVTFLSILNACSHAGLLNVAQLFFTSMSIDYDIIPLEEHYACTSDFLARTGSLGEAEDLLINMLVKPSSEAWNSLLCACRIHGDVERGARAAENVLDLDLEDVTPYVLLSSIYATVGRWEDAAKVRKAMEEKASTKKSVLPLVSC